MGYESKVFIVERTKNNAFIMASFDLWKVGWDNQEFYRAFKKEIDFTLYIPVCDGETEICKDTDTDMYGAPMKSAEISDLLCALEICEQRGHYWRFPPLIACLKEIIKVAPNGNKILAVHYGY